MRPRRRRGTHRVLDRPGLAPAPIWVAEGGVRGGFFGTLAWRHLLFLCATECFFRWNYGTYLTGEVFTRDIVYFVCDGCEAGCQF